MHEHHISDSGGDVGDRPLTRLRSPAVLVAAVLLAAGATGCTGAPQPGESSASTAPSTSSVVSPAGDAPPTSGSAGTTSSASPSTSLRVVALDPGVSDEASGIAASSTAPGLFFLIDDGTGTDDLAVMDEQGSLVTRVILTGMAAGNAEALAVGSCGSVPLSDAGSADRCLYVGDIGDNKVQRDDIVIYRAAEPDLSGAGPDGSVAVAADEWRYTYSDGPHNAESMMTEPDGSLVIVTKPINDAPHRIYRGSPGGGELSFVRDFRVPGSERPLRTILTGNLATDVSATPGRVLLLTYDDVHEYTAPDPSADLTTFPDWPVRSLPFPQVPQAEGITGAADGCGYAVVSEAGPAGSAGSLGIATCP